MPASVINSEEEREERELAYWLAFAWLSGSGLGFARVKRLFEHFESLEQAWKTPEGQLRKLPWLDDKAKESLIAHRKITEPAQLLENLHSQGIKAFHYYHHGYPARLREIHDPPIVLFQKGNLVLHEMDPVVAIVGTRRPTAYGQKLAKEISNGLAESGATVVSGMALGIDSLAHWGAIEIQGRTLAVLGSGVDDCYPSSNKHLYKTLIESEGRAVVSEFLPGTKPQTWHFPARNRIISGLAEAIVVIEAGESSGALITANMAFEQSREVFAVPGRVDTPMSIGTNQLIVQNKAHLCRNYMDIINEMGWASSSGGTARNAIVQLYGREQEVYELIAAEPVHFDYLLEKTGMNTGELSATLTMLELASLVTRLAGDWYARESQRAKT